LKKEDQEVVENNLLHHQVEGEVKEMLEVGQVQLAILLG